MANFDNNINNLSYTSKDFESIYPELLDLVKNLTDKWDPSTSNESDPGVVLIKLMAIMADKNDYNIDKNILEAFPLSVTQRGNARKLYDQLGYNMKWYQSATTKITLSTNLSALGIVNGVNKDEVDPQVKFPRFTTMVTTDDKKIVYTLINDVILNKNNLSSQVDCIQGIAQEYIINGSNIITLDNLDADNCLYFTETQVAENGVYIFNNVEGSASNYDWVRVDNLAIQPLGTTCFKFGVTANNTCYIQFPTDINDLIASGLRIYYVLSNGNAGNAGATMINTFYSDNEITIESPVTNVPSDTEAKTTIVPSEDILVRNASSAVGGKDPESLNEAYNNFKHLIGTFDTLVSCRDYENYIYNLKNDITNQYLVSNVRVSDRTNDLNNTQYVVTLDSATGEERKELEMNDNMNAFAIQLYLLTNSPDITTDNAYNRGFTKAPADVYNNTSLDDNSVPYRLQDVKAIQHDYINFKSGDIFIIKNLCSLSGSLITYYKVTAAEATEIESRVKQALRANYGAHQVDWGEEINYDNLLDTIQNADDRIKTVVLNEPIYKSFAIMVDANIPPIPLENIYEKSDEKVKKLASKLVANMIRSGNVPLFQFDDEFRYNFGQSTKDIPKPIIKHIEQINTNLNIPEDELKNGYKLKANENIYLSAPNPVTTTQYGAYVNYRAEGFTKSNSNGESIPTNPNDIVIPANTTYTLKGDEIIKLNWGDDSTKNKTLSAGTTITPNFALKSAPANDDSSYIQKDGSRYRSLNASESISVMKINSSNLEDNIVYCFWLTKKVTENNKGTDEEEDDTLTYTLMEDGQEDYILQNDEYFIYTNTAKNELFILGSGTRISRYEGTLSKDGKKNLNNYNSGSGQSTTAITCTIPKSLTVNSINYNGLNAISDEIWKSYRGSETGYLTLTEMQIITLGEGASLKINGNNISYKTNDKEDFKSVPNITNAIDIDGENIEWVKTPILNISTSPENPQLIGEHQTVNLSFIEDDIAKSTSLSKGQYFVLNEAITMAGPSINLKAFNLNIIDPDKNNNEDDYPIDAYIFEAPNIDSSEILYLKPINEYTTYTLNNELGSGISEDLIPEGTSPEKNISNAKALIKLQKDLTFTFQANTPYLLCIVANFKDQDNTELFLEGKGLRLFSFTGNNAYYISSKDDTSSIIIKNGINYICINNENTWSGSIINGGNNLTADGGFFRISNIHKLPTLPPTENKNTLKDYGLSQQIIETFNDSKVNVNDTTNLDLMTLLFNNLQKKDEDNTYYPNYYILYKVPNTDSINTEVYGQNKGVLTAGALWDPNNFLNRYTLPQLDLNKNNYNLKIAYSSRIGGGGSK